MGRPVPRLSEMVQMLARQPWDRASWARASVVGLVVPTALFVAGLLLMTSGERAASVAFGAWIAGGLYALTLPFESRHPALLMFAVLVTALPVFDGGAAGSHAGLAPVFCRAVFPPPPHKYNELVIKKSEARKMSFALATVWLLDAAVLWSAFAASRFAASQETKAKTL